MARPVIIHDETLGGMGDPSLQNDGEEVPMMSEAERDRMRKSYCSYLKRDGAPL